MMFSATFPQDMGRNRGATNVGWIWFGQKGINWISTGVLYTFVVDKRYLENINKYIYIDLSIYIYILDIK